MLKNDTATHEEVLKLLDGLLEKRSSEWWTEFYSDPNRKCPFFTENPNEDLIELVETGKIFPPAKVLETWLRKRQKFQLSRQKRI